MSNTRTNHVKGAGYLLLTLFGIVVFCVLYFIASLYYPGGSDFDRTSVGFDWVNNYWCDLTGEYSKNGKVNGARKIAIPAMVVLSLSLSLFWFHLPIFFKKNRYNIFVFRYLGISSMLVIIFLYTNFHDTVIALGGMLIIIPLIGIYRELYKYSMIGLLAFGIFCLLLVVVNYFIYITGFFILYLPLIQKITFACFLLWIAFLNMQCIDILDNTRQEKRRISLRSFFRK